MTTPSQLRKPRLGALWVDPRGDSFRMPILKKCGVRTFPCLKQTGASLSPHFLGRLCLNRESQVGPPSNSTLTSKRGPGFLTTPSQLQKPRLGALWVDPRGESFRMPILKKCGVRTFPCLKQTGASLSPHFLGRLCLNWESRVGPPSTSSFLQKHYIDEVVTNKTK